MKVETKDETLNGQKEAGINKERELSVKENLKLEKLRSASEEVVAKAIREMLRKDTLVEKDR